MERLAGCLGNLTERQRRVLVLRAGVGPREPISRSRVGRRLDLPTTRVARIERRGMRRLLVIGDGGCGGSGSAVAIAEALGGSGSTGGSPPSHPLATAGAGTDGGREAATGGGGASDPRSDVRAEFESSGQNDGNPALVVPPVPQDDGGASLSILALLIGLFLLGYALRRELGSRDPAPH